MAEVFISYRRSGAALLANLIYEKLLARGVSAFVDTRVPMGSGEFPDLLRRQIEEVSTVIVVLEPDWMSSAWMQEEVRYAVELGRTLVPVFADGYELPSGPQPAHITALLSHNGVRVLTRQGIFIDEAMATVVDMVAGREPARTTPGTRPAVDVALDQLPVPMVDELVGRAEESALLRRHLADPDVAVVTVSGFGGIGKSSLVDAFLSAIAPSYGGVAKVFAWHFNSQEESGTNVAGSASFWDSALRFLGARGPLPGHEIERARELARLLEQTPTVLVLDGMESLQFPRHIRHGQLSDQAMQVFLTTIGRNGLGNGGLVLVTSRQPVVEMLRFRFVRGVELGTLDARAGHELLRDLGVRGSTEEMLAAVRDHQGHPLSLVLLARMLTDSYDGDILHRVYLEVFDADTDIEDSIALILDRYVAGWDEDSPELTVLYAVSLFRRPAEEEELNLLAERSDLGRRLRVLSGNQVRKTVSRLRGLGLVMAGGGRYDQHALVRQYFAGRFAQRHPQLHRQAHDVLFDHFRALPEEELPVDLRTMEPLYRAIHHGCCAGRYALALDVYWNRVSRQREFYSQKHLGAYSSDLVAIAPFFPDGWETPVQGDLTEEQRALLIALGAFLLAALGRLADSVRPRYTEIAMFEELGDLRLVSGDLRNLVQALVPLGRLEEALRAADRAVEVAGRMGSAAPGTYSAGFDDRFLQVSALVRRATVLHRMGRLADAGRTFDEARRLQDGPLTRVNAYYHGLYLADVARGRDDAEALLQLGLHNLASATERGDLGDIGYSLLVTAHARRALGESAAAEADLDSAVVALNRANRIDRLPAVHIQRAEVYRERWLADGDDAWRELAGADLAEAERLVEFSGMLLYRVDLVALRVALLLDVGDRVQARVLIDTVLQPDVELTGYHMREDVVAALRERAGVR